MRGDPSLRNAVSGGTVEAGDARLRLWMNFHELARPGSETLPAIMSGRGTRIFDGSGRELLDALSSLYCVNAGHGRVEIAEAMAKQAAELSYFPAWGQPTPALLALAERVTSHAPGDLDRVFFTSGGAESVDTAWKMVRQYHRLRGNPGKVGMLARANAYHGTTLGALPVTGLPSLREPFGPLMGGIVHGPAVNAFHSDVDPVQHSIDCAEEMAKLLLSTGPENVGAIIVEPVQNSGGCLTPEPVYYERLRSLCDEHDLLLISDETICGWGRLGAWFGCERLGYQPDIVTTAKGLTSAYAPMGAVIASEKVVEPFLEPGVVFSHGLTFGGHPVAAAAALANIGILEREDLCAKAVATGASLRAELEALREFPIVGDVRGMGLFLAVELVSDQETRAGFQPEQLAALKAHVPRRIQEQGIVCRAMHRGAPTLQFAPPLIADEEDLAWLLSGLRIVLSEAVGLVREDSAVASS